MSRTNRRTFLKGTLAAAGAGFAIGGTKSSGRIVGANEAIRVAVAGVNGRGKDHIGELARVDGVRITHLVDPDTRTFARAAALIEERGGSTPETLQDVRRVLENKDVDVLTIAAPNHWHALLTIWGCQAGKDVYVEKPCSHDVREGRVAVEVARKHDRIVQHGTQSRSDRRWAQVAEIARTGKLGKLKVARGLCYKPRESIGVKPDGAPPAELDYNLWLGPAEERPFNPNYVHYNWHWFWPFGNGDIGNQGVHQMDIARWMIPGATLPTGVVSLGGRFGYKDQADTPNTQLAAMPFGETLLIFEVRGLPTDEYRGLKVGDVLHFEGGTVTDRAFFPSDSDRPADLPAVDVQRGPGRGHFGNFIEAVRSRKADDLNADILEGHYSSALCHLANLSYRLGEMVPFGSQARTTPSCAELDEAFERMVEHLAKTNGLKLDGTEYRMGRRLTFDPKTERFTGDGSDDANALLTRKYRAPFVVPESV
jgi:predicted dehydrogenase